LRAGETRAPLSVMTFFNRNHAGYLGFFGLVPELE
jgi:hypothetical protein